MELKEKIKKLSAEYFSEIVEIRRHFHANPELSFNETQTSKFIENKLKEYKISKISRIAKNGIVALIEGKNPSKKIIALRADIDALPICEETDAKYKSKNEGIMHACGHDVHASTLLGVSKILTQLTSEFEGTIKIIFQPAEEKLPGGAKQMIAEGVLKKPDVEIIIAQHVEPTIEAGKVGFKSGLYMASTDEIYITVKGKGGHAAIPEDLTDTVLIASHIIVALQQVVSRNSRASVPTVLSFGKVTANGATNVIPDEVFIEGTFRTMNETWRKSAHQKINQIASSVAEAMGGKAIVYIKEGYPSLTNAPKIAESAFKIAENFLGTENVKELEVRMTAEDFAYFTNEIPGLMYRLGTRNEAKGITHHLHTSTFDVDEKAIETGMGFMSFLAIEMLNE